MSFSNQSPDFRRYLKASLPLFKRPVFWASTVGLLLVVLFAWKYWNNPESFNALLGNQVTESKKPTVNPTLSSENPVASSVDPNSSSMPGKELDRTSALPPINLPNQKAQLPYLPGGLPRATSQTPTISSQGQNNLNLTGMFPQKLNTGNTLATSPQNVYTPSLRGGSGLATFPTSGKSSLSIARASTDPTFSLNSLNSRNTSRGIPSLGSLPNASSRATALSTPPSRTNQAQIPSLPQPQALPTLSDQRQIPSLPATVASPTNTIAAQGQIPSVAATIPSPTNTIAAQGQTPSVAATIPSPTSNPTSQGRLPAVPTTVPSPTGNNASPTTPTALPTVASSQPISQIPATVQVKPVQAFQPNDFRQPSPLLPDQTNAVTNPGFYSVPENPGLQQSQLNLPTFTVPSLIPGNNVGDGQTKTLSEP